VVADRIHTAPREVKLTSNVDHIAFHYKGLTLKTQFNQIRYIYQLEGYDTDWCPSTRKRIAQYNHLNPGTYVFKVKAIDRDLNDSEPASVTLKVVLPFYLRAGFLVPTVGGGAILLVILVIQAIILVKRRRQVLAYQQAAVHELRDAREMQLSLLPKNAPHIEGFDIASACEPATDVGGDYFTYLWLNEAKTQFGIVLMDVTGHGMKAATTTFLANGMLQAESRNKQSPCEIMAKMHQSLQDILPRRAFVATSFACINLRDKTLTHFNAALPEPILLRNGKPVELQIQSNPPLGSPFRAEYSGTTVPLRAGDVLLFFSDGLPDARDDLEQVYQEARLETLLDSLVAQPQPAQAWVDAILTDVHAFSGELEDDLTIVVVRVL